MQCEICGGNMLIVNYFRQAKLCSQCYETEYEHEVMLYEKTMMEVI